jgi:hypothetical protein
MAHVGPSYIDVDQQPLIVSFNVGYLWQRDVLLSFVSKQESTRLT